MNWYISDKGSLWRGELRMACAITATYDKAEEFRFRLLGFLSNGIAGLLLFNSMLCPGLFSILYMSKRYLATAKFLPV